MIVLFGNKIDLAHMQAVKPEQHEGFAQKEKLSGAYYVSAKSGDQIMQCFYKLAADLAGVEVPKGVMEMVTQSQVRAEIQAALP